jgi:hypothetical protein
VSGQQAARSALVGVDDSVGTQVGEVAAVVQA